MEIVSVWVNRVEPTGRWYPIVRCRKWHQKLRLAAIKLLLKWLNNEKDICLARNDTG